MSYNFKASTMYGIGAALRPVNSLINANAVRRTVLLTALACLLGGCSESGPSLDRQSITGTVTLDGTPLAVGTIRFEPFGEAQGKLTAAGTSIQAGKYELTEVEGLPPGKYAVSIGSHGDESANTLPSDPTEAMNAAGKLKPLPELIPSKYNTNTELVIDVVKDGTTPFNFELQSTKK